MILKDKIAVVTGGSRGIGKAIVNKFSELGATVYSFSRSENSIKNEQISNGKIITIVCDIRDEKQARTQLKDVGLFPLYFNLEYDINAQILCLGNTKNGTKLDKYKNITIQKLRKEDYPTDYRIPTGILDYFKIISLLKPIKAFLQANAEKISHIMLFHITVPTAIISFWIKKLNPKIRIYVKGDTTYQLNLIGKIIFSYLMHTIDLFSCETTQATSTFKQKHNRYSNKIFYVPNGIIENR